MYALVQKSNFYNLLKYSTILSKVIQDDLYILLTRSYQEYAKFIKLECKKCSNTWTPRTNDYLQSRSNCPTCSRNNQSGFLNKTTVQRRPLETIFLYEFEIKINNSIYYKYGLSINPKRRLYKLRQEMRKFYPDVEINLRDTIERIIA
ncbi:hypothetical protein FDH01_gp133 [Acinetobacter phage vB_AbaM_ME3]|uniref:Uncharacterized protein n=1 Tax=Acinetobacter phage vB_AbaM_ME3 TaxID=1837876 RepID=A0A172Q0C6_9CAUD|nr:hypothetical protein FDH01_gp133 [Acinetobacter phage vB_AbaM_ME3]AND75294.1 hypothetical protein ME3_133 [Acinetobacter phage vB_AbaM_ME3]